MTSKNRITLVMRKLSAIVFYFRCYRCYRYIASMAITTSRFARFSILNPKGKKLPRTTKITIETKRFSKQNKNFPIRKKEPPHRGICEEMIENVPSSKNVKISPRTRQTSKVNYPAKSNVEKTSLPLKKI